MTDTVQVSSSNISASYTNNILLYPYVLRQTDKVRMWKEVMVIFLLISLSPHFVKLSETLQCYASFLEQFYYRCHSAKLILIDAKCSSVGGYWNASTRCSLSPLLQVGFLSGTGDHETAQEGLKCCNWKQEKLKNAPKTH